ncbi:hypothetical protein RhiirA5_507338 [Rhizophagus irregularis]|uniref:Uncharacterized protein n=1 Tax=Rhizophagus irregularis TaxID=588596 RepID=A0A2N0NL30_9GLOM|nr:hypothetical protein RhiirA5_507338 [Rhizophagus irregularis]
MEFNLNPSKTQIFINVFFNINENNKVEAVFESSIFELNKADVKYNENFESNSDSNYDEFESDNEENKNDVDGKIQNQGDGCSKHFRKLLEKNIQIICNRQHTCPALRECDPVCIPAFEDVKNSRCICS